MPTVSVPFDSFDSFSSVTLQGEAGAYSEKSLRELLGNHVVAVGHESFEDAFKAVGYPFSHILDTLLYIAYTPFVQLSRRSLLTTESESNASWVCLVARVATHPGSVLSVCVPRAMLRQGTRLCVGQIDVGVAVVQWGTSLKGQGDITQHTFGRNVCFPYSGMSCLYSTNQITDNGVSQQELRVLCDMEQCSWSATIVGR